MFLLAQAVKQLPATTVYAVFVGIGTAGTAFTGMVLFGETITAARVFSFLLIVAGVIGLKLFSPPR
jgi:quaternary ammonium compound-resistance protein SugE